MGHTSVKSVVKTVALEVDVLGHARVKRIVAQVVPVELPWQIRVPYVVDLRYTRQSVSRRSIRRLVRSDRSSGCCRLKLHIIMIF